jgi:hypothetical protein
MTIFIYTIISATCSSILCLFSFWIGRCSRRLPIIDNNLPWTMSREQAPRCTADCASPQSREPQYLQADVTSVIVSDSMDWTCRSAGNAESLFG